MSKTAPTHLLRCAMAVVAGAALSLSAAAGSNGLLVGDAPEGLLRPATDAHGFAAVSNFDARTDVVRARFVSLDDTLIETPRAAASSVTLNLFDDVSLDVVFTRTEPGLNVDRVLVGHVEGMDHSYAVMVETDGHVWMDVFTLDAGQYEIRNAGGNIHLVAQVGGPLGVCGVQNLGPQQLEVVGADEPGADQEPGNAGDRDTGDLIDLLILYTPAARSIAGGTTNMTNAMNGWATSTNIYYTNSQMIQRIRLVHLAETTYTEATSGQGGMETDLSRFRGTGDAFIPEVHTLRNTYGADLCHLVSNSTGPCGIAYLQLSAASGFGVTRYTCGVRTIAHELGHNMGCQHDHPNAGGGGAFCYSFAHFSSSFRTVMYWQIGGPEIPFFSNPNITVGGQVIGVPEVPGCSQGTAADNARSMNNTRFTVANYRQQQVGNPPPADFNIISPPDGAVGVSTQPILEWQPAEFANTYDIIVSEEADLSPAIIDLQNLAVSALAVPAATLESCTEYFWQVTAVGFGGETIGSPTVASFTTRLVGDVNGSGTVDFADLNQLVFAFGQTGPNAADVDGDGDVDFADLNLLLSNYNISCN